MSQTAEIASIRRSKAKRLSAVPRAQTDEATAVSDVRELPSNDRNVMRTYMQEISKTALLTRPIAGTRHRGKTEAEDLELEQDLLADEKEKAEHLMLVDLARNDIGRVCQYGTVEVFDYMTIERYSHVMHIVSQVVGTIRPDKNAYDLLRATFPAGTLSGAPKVRALQIISELEQSQRGVYGGAIGYFSYDGNHDSAIGIRTALIKDNKIYIQSGAGIVADSIPESEFMETVNKAKGMLKAVVLSEDIFGS